MSSTRVPSAVLLRTFLKPVTIPRCALQSRNASNYMPRSKYAKITPLDKLHRTLKAALREDKLAALQRADAILATIPSQDPNSSIQKPAFPFIVTRTPSNQLPVYESRKHGGSKQITTIRKLSGDLDSLAAQLRDVLKLTEFVVDRKGNKKANIAVNRLTSHLVIRGWRGSEVKAWMEAVGF